MRTIWNNQVVITGRHLGTINTDIIWYAQTSYKYLGVLERRHTVLININFRSCSYKQLDPICPHTIGVFPLATNIPHYSLVYYNLFVMTLLFYYLVYIQDYLIQFFMELCYSANLCFL